MNSSPGFKAGDSPDQPPITCPQCGTSLPAFAHFCPHCGYRFTQQEPQPSPASAPTAPLNTPASTTPTVAVPSPLLQQPLPEATPPLSPLSPPTMPIAPRSGPSVPFSQARAKKTSTPPFIEKGIELWWVRVPAFLRRRSLLLSEIWSDGIYLTVRPVAAILLPLFALLFGILEGLTHWTLMIGTEPAITFTEMLPLLCLVSFMGALSMHLGFLLVLGYALGDLLLGQHLPQMADLQNSSVPFPFLLFYLTLFVSYGLFFMLAFIPTFIGRYLALGIVNYIKGNKSFLLLLRTLLQMLAVAGVVNAYTQAGPLMIRVLWGWASLSPPVSAAYYLQTMGYLIVIAAILGSLVRGLGTYLASHNTKVMIRSRRLLVGLLRADRKPAFTRRVPPLVQVTVLAAVMSLLVSGLFGDLLQGAIFFLFVWVLLSMRMIWLPRLAFWQTWTNILAFIPLLLRVLLGAFLIYYICGGLMEQLFSAPVLINNPSGSFQWLLVSSCIGLVIMTALTPQPPALTQQKRSVRENAKERRRLQ